MLPHKRKRDEHETLTKEEEVETNDLTIQREQMITNEDVETNGMWIQQEQTNTKEVQALRDECQAHLAQHLTLWKQRMFSSLPSWPLELIRVVGCYAWSAWDVYWVGLTPHFVTMDRLCQEERTHIYQAWMNDFDRQLVHLEAQRSRVIAWYKEADTSVWLAEDIRLSGPRTMGTTCSGSDDDGTVVASRMKRFQESVVEACPLPVPSDLADRIYAWLNAAIDHHVQQKLLVLNVSTLLRVHQHTLPLHEAMSCYLKPLCPPRLLLFFRASPFWLHLVKSGARVDRDVQRVLWTVVRLMLEHTVPHQFVSTRRFFSVPF